VPQFPEILFLTIGLGIGFVVGVLAAFLILRNREERARSEAKSASDVLVAQLTERASRVPLLQSELAESVEQLRLETCRTAALTEQASRLSHVDEALERAVHERDGLKIQIAELKSVLAGERDRLALRDQDKRQMSDAFQTLANEILDQKTAKFTQLNKTNIDEILVPLRTKIVEFQEEIKKLSTEDGKGRAVLGAGVEKLVFLNQQLSEDAKNLTTALKGSSKTQGNWGEMILERVLEASGLQRGRDYELRESYAREDGRRGQPDVVINLPQDRHLVIDAKVSLTDYESSVNAADDSEREACATRHVQSVRRHVKGLSEQNYQELHALKTLDFVIMFIPIEPAYAAAINTDGSLWETALKKNVLLVSPSVLFSVLRIVAVLWKQEKQAQHVKAIADRGAELYNKLVGFVGEFEKVGRAVGLAQRSFEEARGKLSAGPGNVIRQAEMLKGLGVRTSKSLPQGMIEEAMQEILPELAAFAEITQPEEERIADESETLADEEVPF
jgi:DNA recombination protein RmuC